MKTTNQLSVQITKQRSLNVYKNKSPICPEIQKEKTFLKQQQEEEMSDEELIKFYSVEQIAKRTKTEEAPIIVKPRTPSPVLTSVNPFKKNKLSKFQHTNVDYASAMRSRFFVNTFTSTSVSAEKTHTTTKNTEDSTIQESVENLQIETNIIKEISHNITNSESPSCKEEENSNLKQNADSFIFEAATSSSLKENYSEAINVSCFLLYENK